MRTVFSRNLASVREERKISQRQAADGLGVSQALLSHYERGIREPNFAFLIRASEFYGVSADYLIGHYTLSREKNMEELLEQCKRIAELSLLINGKGGDQ